MAKSNLDFRYEFYTPKSNLDLKYEFYTARSSLDFEKRILHGEVKP